MQKLILDTNVIVSALISKSIPSIILYDLVLTKKVETCISIEIFSEYLEVLNRAKFSKFVNFKRKAEIVLTKLYDISTVYPTNQKLDILKDASDNKFLELAAVSSADFLITGNTRDFTLSEFQHSVILTPRAYWERYRICD